MRDIELQPTAAAHWHALVCEAEQKARHELGEDVQSYLVFLLQRFLSRPEIASRILALDYLAGLLSTGHQQHDKLRDVGDICLLYAGLYPQRARRRRVSVNYYVDLGIGAYHQLHGAASHSLGRLYAQLSERFVPAMDVLQTMRELGADAPALDPLTAFELWETTHSQRARDTLTGISTGTPVRAHGQRRH